MAIKVVLVEDDPFFHTSVKEIIESSMCDLQLKDVFTNAEDFIQAYELGIRPDVVLMDFDLSKGKGKLTGIDCVKLLRQKYPRSDTQFVMYTTFQSPEVIVEALKAGAVGYITKSDSENLIKAIRNAEKGSGKMTDSVARIIMDIFFKHERAENKVLQDANLTEREKEVLQHLMKGLKYQQIADQLFVDKETINTHVKNIYSKLRVHSRGEVIQILSTSVNNSKICEQCGGFLQ